MKEYFKPFLLSGTIEITLKYKDKPSKLWVADKESLCSSILSITEDFARQGYRITLRQLYYQLVKGEIIPNHITVYKKLGKVKDDMAYGGLLDWGTFEDRGRKPQNAYTEETPEGAIDRAHKYYNLDKQEGQKVHIEVWTEKDAISGILSRITEKYTVPLIINKGYSGSTAMYESYRRFLQALAAGKQIKIIYFGDHDPSGLDMIRDIEERIGFMISRGKNDVQGKAIDWFNSDDCEYSIYDVAAIPGFHKAVNLLKPKPTKKHKQTALAGITLIYLKHNNLFTVEHVGLTQEQIKKYDPPPNPAKLEDPRATGYVKKFGAVSWEVDALTPAVMTSIVEKAILKHMDKKVYNKVLTQEKKDKVELSASVKLVSADWNYAQAQDYLHDMATWVNDQDMTATIDKSPMKLIVQYEKNLEDEEHK